MFKKSSLYVLTIMVVTATVLSACDGGAAPTAAPQPQQPAATPY